MKTLIALGLLGLSLSSFAQVKIACSNQTGTFSIQKEFSVEDKNPEQNQELLAIIDNTFGGMVSSQGMIIGHIKVTMPAKKLKCANVNGFVSCSGKKVSGTLEYSVKSQGVFGSSFQIGRTIKFQTVGLTTTQGSSDGSQNLDILDANTTVSFELDKKTLVLNLAPSFNLNSDCK